MASTFLRKYNTVVSGTTVISIPLIKAGVSNYAVSADWTPTVGDVVISRDGGSWGNISNLPIARTAGNASVWDFILTGTETQASQTRVLISDAATKAIEDDYFIVEFFGNVSGMHTIDYTNISQDSNGYIYCDIASVSGTRIQSPSIAGTQKVDISLIGGGQLDTSTAQIGVNVVKWSGVQLPYQETGGVPDVNIKNVLGATAGGSAGYLGIDWSATANTSASINLVNTAISGVQVYTGNTKQTGDSYIRIGNAGINLTSIVASSVLGNTAQTGDAYSIVSNVTYGNSALKTLVDTTNSYIDTEIASIKAKTDNLPSDPADASDIAIAFSTVNSTLATIISYIDTEISAIKSKTDNLPLDPADASDISTSFSTVNNLLSTISGYIDTEISSIKNQTDKLIFNSNNHIVSDVASISGNRLPNTVNQGYMPIDWGNIGGKTSNVNLSDTSISGVNHLNITGITGDITGNINGNIFGYVSISGITQPVASGLANTLLSQSTKCTENTAPSGSLTEIILQSTNSVITDSTLNVRRSDGTFFSTKSLGLVADSPAIRSIQ